MSLYNMIFGTNRSTPALLATLNLKEDDIPRFRNAYISEGNIAVYTRMGGGNYGCWEDKNVGEECNCIGCNLMKLERTHPHFVEGRDDDFDNTYRTLYFSFPPEFRIELEALDTGERIDPSKRWLDMIEALGAK